jgi:hypothetical protein
VLCYFRHYCKSKVENSSLTGALQQDLNTGVVGSVVSVVHRVEAKASALRAIFPKGTVNLKGNFKISAASLPTSRAVPTYRGLEDGDMARSSSSSSFLCKSGLRHHHRCVAVASS